MFSFDDVGHDSSGGVVRQRQQPLRPSASTIWPGMSWNGRTASTASTAERAVKPKPASIVAVVGPMPMPRASARPIAAGWLRRCGFTVRDFAVPAQAKSEPAAVACAEVWMSPRLGAALALAAVQRSRSTFAPRVALR